MEKRALVRFISKHAPPASARQVGEALDYALKRKPSFGGYILSSRMGGKPIAALVVNRTGMKGYSPSHLVVFSVMDPDHDQAEAALLQLIEKAIGLTRGDLALQVSPDSSFMPLYQELGFQPRYLQLKLEKPNVMA